MEVKDSPTSRTLRFLRAAGMTVQVVEKWNPHAKIRQDLFGCIDVVALHHGVPGILGVQATTTANAAARLLKIMAIPAAKLWVECGNRLWVVGWRKLKTRKWEPRITEVTVGMFSEVGGAA